MKKKLPLILFICYLIAFVLIVLLKFDGSFDRIRAAHESIAFNREMGVMNVNLEPFVTIRRYWNQVSYGYAFRNLVGNVVAFVPMGFFLSLLAFRKNLIKNLLASALIVLLVEGIQFIFMIGYFDVDDIILNVAGCLVGYMIGLATCLVQDRRR